MPDDGGVGPQPADSGLPADADLPSDAGLPEDADLRADAGDMSVSPVDAGVSDTDSAIIDVDADSGDADMLITESDSAVGTDAFIDDAAIQRDTETADEDSTMDARIVDGAIQTEADSSPSSGSSSGGCMAVPAGHGSGAAILLIGILFCFSGPRRRYTQR